MKWKQGAFATIQFITALDYAGDGSGMTCSMRPGCERSGVEVGGIIRYDRITEGRFVSRPNRFIAMVEVDGEVEKCHVKNTGRCREILVPGARVILQESDSETRKTRYDLIAAYKGDMLINIDSQAPNTVFGEYIRSSGMFSEDAVVRPEYTHGDSRFDFYVEDGTRRILIEVKGVTLEFDGVCMFPDAPTERGVKHLKGLANALEEGYECMVCLVVQMRGMDHFVPNYVTHREFGEVLEDVCSKGVLLRVLECQVDEDGLEIIGEIPYRFE